MGERDKEGGGGARTRREPGADGALLSFLCAGPAAEETTSWHTVFAYGPAIERLSTLEKGYVVLCRPFSSPTRLGPPRPPLLHPPPISRPSTHSITQNAEPS